MDNKAKIELAGGILRNGASHAYRVVEVAMNGGGHAEGLLMLKLQRLKKDGTDAMQRPAWVEAEQWVRAIESGRATFEQPKTGGAK